MAALDPNDKRYKLLDAAMRKALNGTFPNLQHMQRVDYKVRVVNSEAATAAGVRVVIESRDEHAF